MSDRPTAENDAPWRPCRGCGIPSMRATRNADGLCIGCVIPPAENGLRDRIVAVLRAEGGEPGSSLHSWRCEHPDRYGECDCLEQTADEIIRVIPPVKGDG